jgi:protein SCO1/2
MSIFRITLALVLALAIVPARAGEAPTVDRKLGTTVPLDLTFTSETGQEVTLAEVITKPTVLSLIYYRCPAACTPLLRAIAKAVDGCDLEPGTDYQLLSISFDERERDKLEVVRTAKAALLGDMKKKIPPASWSFLTGKAAAIEAIKEAVGFRTVKDGDDFLHPLAIMFISPEGKLTRYLNPTRTATAIQVLPADLTLAIMDASDGRVGTFMQKLERLCYGYDPEESTYIFHINRLILAITAVFVLVFGAFLLLIRRKAPPPAPWSNEGDPA